MNDSLKSLIQLYKTLDESKHILEDVINQFGIERQNNIQSLPKDIQDLVDIARELNTEQRKTLMKFIESLKQG